MVVEQKGM